MAKPGVKIRLRNFLLHAGISERTLGWLGFLVNPQKIRYALDQLHDYRRVREQLGGFIGNGAADRKPVKKIMFLSLHDMVYQFKAELMLAKALQMNGCEVIVARRRSKKAALNYFRLFGLTDIVFVEDFEDRRAGKALWETSARQLKPALSVPELLALDIRNVHAGQHALSTAFQSLQKGHLDLDSPETKKTIHAMFKQAVEQIPTAENLFDAVRPDTVIFFEKGYLPEAPYFDVALNRKVDTVQWQGAQETNAYVLRRYTNANRLTHPFSLSPETWGKVAAMPWSGKLDEEVLTMLTERYELDSWYNRNKLRARVSMHPPEGVRRILKLDPSKKTVVVFSHILWDATFFWGVNLFGDYGTWLIEVVKAACKNDRVNWVIKLHPDYVWKLARTGGTLEEPDLFAQTFGTLPDHVRLMLPDADINTYSLFKTTDICLTVRGTVGIEMSSLGIPVLTAGTGRYSNLGFTIDSGTVAEYLDRLAHIEDTPHMTPEQITLARKFAYSLFKLRPFKFQTFTTVFKDRTEIQHPLFMNYDYNVRSRADLENAADLREFARWIIHSRHTDFIKPLPGENAS